MYQYSTPITVSKQIKRARKSGFTLVEIMIVILIIVALTQMGNFTSLFRNREKSQIEDIGVQILSMIDEEKTNALLGKTEQTSSSTWEIVRKRLLTLSTNNITHTINFVARVNLVKSTENVYEPAKTIKSWTLPGLISTWYDCTTGKEGVKLQNAGTDVRDINIEFSGDSFVLSSPAPLKAPHIVLKLESNTANQEIHIDRRTGLTYTRLGVPAKVLCN